MKKLLAAGILALLTTVAHAGMTAEGLSENCSHMHEIGHSTGNSMELGFDIGLCSGYIEAYLATADGSFVNAAHEGQPIKLYRIKLPAEGLDQRVVADEVVTYMHAHPERKDQPAITP
jgi:hypothetical protein